MKTNTIKLAILSCLLFLATQFANAATTIAVTSISTTAGSNGLAADPLDHNQTGIAVAGFNLKAAGGTATITTLTIAGSNSLLSNFSNYKLCKSADGSYTSGTDAAITGSAYTISGNNIVFTFPSQSISNGSSVNYFLVADYSTNASTNAQITFKITTVASGTGLPKSGPTYTLIPQIVLGTATTTGLASGTYSVNTANLGILGFSITTGDSETINSFQLSSTQPLGTYFSNFKLYRNKTQNKYSGTGGATQVTGVTFSNTNSTTITVSGLSDNINNATWYYFIVADYTVASSASVTFQLSLTSAFSGSTAFSYISPVTGPSLTLGADLVNWTGATNTDWNTASNWDAGHVPGPYDTVQLYMGVQPPISANNAPVISTPGNYNLAELDFGGWFVSLGGKYWPGLTLKSGVTLTVANNITYNPDLHPGLVPTPLIPGNNSNLYVMQGNGKLQATNMIIDSRYGSMLTNDDTQQAVVSYLSFLTLTGDLTLYSENYTTRSRKSNQVSTLYLISGTVEIDGNVNTSNVSASASNTTPSSDVSDLVSTFWAAPGSGMSVSLTLKDPAVFSSLTTVGSSSFNFGLANTTVYYAGPSQTIYTNETGGINYYNLTFSGSGAKVGNSGTLFVANTFNNTLSNNSNDYVDFSKSTVEFSGNVTSGNQNIICGTGSGIPFYKVNFSGVSSKTLTNGYFNVIPTGLITMKGTSTSTIFNADAGGLVTLMSDANSSASIGTISSTASVAGPSIKGNINVQRYLTGGNVKYRGYRLLSSPININSSYTGTGNVSLKYVNSDVSLPTVQYGALTAGAVGGGFTVQNGNPTMYLYNEAIPTNNTSFTSGKNVGITAVTSTGVSTLSQGNTGTATIPAGNGFYLYFIGNDQSLVTAATRVPENTVLTASGYVNQGDVAFKLWNTGSTSLSYTAAYGVNAGYNLLGNPYASTIDLHQLYVDNGSKYRNFAMLNDINPNQGFGYYNASTGQKSGVGSQYVASGQGFFVQATATGQTLTFKEDQKVYNTAVLTSTSTPPLVMSTPVKKINNASVQYTQATVQKDTLSGLHLQLAKDVYVDECGIYFNKNWADGYDINDASIMGGSSKISMYSFTRDGNPVGINSLADYKQGKRVKLFVKSALAGVYNLTLEDITNIDTGLYDIYLVDKLKKDSLDIARYKSYAFDLNPSDTSTFGANRFELAIERKPVPPYQLISFNGANSKQGIKLDWKTANEGSSTTFVLQKKNSSGQFNALESAQSNGSASYTYTDNSPAKGANVYRLQQTDIDGNVTYSAAVTVTYSSMIIPASIFTVFPNPTADRITINLGSTTDKITTYISNIYNTAGELVGHRTVNATSWTENVTAYKAGMYVIELKGMDGSFIGKSKFVKTDQ